MKSVRKLSKQKMKPGVDASQERQGLIEMYTNKRENLLERSADRRNVK
jgi:hypothetical protein